MVTATRPRTGGAEPLLDAALEVIAREGPGALTVRAVAAQAGVSPGTVSHHFASVDDLLVGALAHAAHANLARLETLALGLQSAAFAPEQWAQAFARALADDLRDHRSARVACFELQLAAVRRPELAATVEGLREGSVRIAELALRAAGASDPARDAGRLVDLVEVQLLRELTIPKRGAAGRLTDLLLGELRRSAPR